MSIRSSLEALWYYLSSPAPASRKVRWGFVFLSGDVGDFGDVVYAYYVVLEVGTHLPEQADELVTLRNLFDGPRQCAMCPVSILLPVCQLQGQDGRLCLIEAHQQEYRASKRRIREFLLRWYHEV